MAYKYLDAQANWTKPEVGLKLTDFSTAKTSLSDSDRILLSSSSTASYITWSNLKKLFS